MAKRKLGPSCRVRIKRGDCGDRWKSGETGVTIQNDYAEKYDARVLLDGPGEFADLPEFLRDPNEDRQTYPRVFYFYRDELEITK